MANPKRDPKLRHIVLTSHPTSYGTKPIPIDWGNADPGQRSPLIGTLTDPSHRNVIGTHSGSYAIYRALAVVQGSLKTDHRADLTNTSPFVKIGPYPSWADPGKIVALDPFGAVIGEAFTEYLEKGYDIRPTIAITKAHINMPELYEAATKGRLTIDGKIMKKMAI